MLLKARICFGAVILPSNAFALIFFSLGRATESQNAKVTKNAIKETTHPAELDLCSLLSLLALLALSCLQTSPSWPAQSLFFSSSLALESNEPSCGSLLLRLILFWQSNTCCPKEKKWEELSQTFNSKQERLQEELKERIGMFTHFLLSYLEDT